MWLDDEDYEKELYDQEVSKLKETFNKLKRNWPWKILGLVSVICIGYFSTWQLMLAIVAYHIAHVIGRHKNKDE